MSRFLEKVKKCSIIVLVGVFSIHFQAKSGESEGMLSTNLRIERVQKNLAHIVKLHEFQFIDKYFHLNALPHGGKYRYLIHAHSGTTVKCVVEGDSFDSKVSFDAINYDKTRIDGNPRKFDKSATIQFFKKSSSNVYLDVRMNNKSIAGIEDNLGNPINAYYSIWCGAKLGK